MEGFDHILNWKLKAGSHRFPGPDGGTCINEAALVEPEYAAGPRDPGRRPGDRPTGGTGYARDRLHQAGSCEGQDADGQLKAEQAPSQPAEGLARDEEGAGACRLTA